MFLSNVGVPFKVNVGSKYQENPIRDEFIILKNACFFKYMTNSFLPVYDKFLSPWIFFTLPLPTGHYIYSFISRIGTARKFRSCYNSSPVYTVIVISLCNSNSIAFNLKNNYRMFAAGLILLPDIYCLFPAHWNNYPRSRPLRYSNR